VARTIGKKAHELLARSQETGDGAVAEGQLAGLPDPVRRYLHYAQVVGKPPIRTVRLRQRGAMSMAMGSKWLPMTADQYFTTNPPAFLWYGTLHPFPLVSVSATDIYAGGHGTLNVKAWSLIPVAEAHGLETDLGELLRYLAEMVWFPTAFLAGYIRWDAIDAGSARATIVLPPVSVSGIFHMDEQGCCTHFTTERYRLEHKQQVLRPWIGRYDDYREMAGFRIPMRAEVAYTLDTGEFSYFRGEVTEIGYDHCEPS
jgi:uncharacterized protein DUF6544